MHLYDMWFLSKHVVQKCELLLQHKHVVKKMSYFTACIIICKNDKCIQITAKLRRWLKKKQKSNFAEFLPQRLHCSHRCRFFCLSTSSPKRGLIIAALQPGMEQCDPRGWKNLVNTSFGGNVHTARKSFNRVIRGAASEWYILF